MFTDMSLSRDINDQFKSFREESGKDLGVDFGILVLATGSWPLQVPSTGFSIPKELQECATAFQQFYQNKHTGRKLNWLHNLSKGELKMKYATTNKAGYTLQCSAYQMGILLQFNGQDALNTKELQVATQLGDNVLINTLRTLLKTKVLLVEPKLADEKAAIEPSHTFTLNKLFKTPKGRVKVNINIRVEAEGQGGAGGAGGKDPDDPMPAVIEERKILIQAAVVRIMKSRKKAKHANLVSEVVTQLQQRFKPQITLIKRCIDILIEKEYLERVENEKDTYSYIA
jgi:cullin 1